MCGIVGYAGPNKGLNIVLEGLSRLEYRGYDSAGVSLKIGNKLEIYKKEGKLLNLKNELANKPIDSHLAIGHTRWATHGIVNDTNAHPHGDSELAVVHNGIIENSQEIKEKLTKEGYKFKSETDTETFYLLLKRNLKTSPSTERAILDTFSEIRGNSAFVIITANEDKIYAIKRSAPLVCGIEKNNSEALLSSDPYALVGYANLIFFPEDEVLCVGDYKNKNNIFTFLEKDLSVSKRYKVQEQKMSHESISKGNFDHFMLKEIHEQPKLIRDLVLKYLDKDKYSELMKLSSFKPSFVHIIGCGTAWHAGLVIKNFIEKYAGIRSSCEQASEFRYRNPIIKNDELALFISQSGETADTLACQEMCKKAGVKTYSIVNVSGSSLYRNADYNFLIYAGQEIGVASTKAFTQQVITGFILSKILAGEDYSKNLETNLKKLADKIEDILKRESEIKEIAEQLYLKNGYIFTGRGDDFPIALEGALKLKEIAYVHAEGYASGELKHGPISLIDESMVNIAIITPQLYEKTFSNAEEVKARRGIMFCIGDKSNLNLNNFSDYFFGFNINDGQELNLLSINVVLQLFSYHVAKLKGTDIDKPRNLAKSVTVE